MASDDVLFKMGADASKLHSEFTKSQAKIEALSKKIEEMAGRTKKSAGSMSLDFARFSQISVDAEDKLARLKKTHEALNGVNNKMANSPVFPKIIKGIERATSATSSLINKTISYGAALAVIYKTITATTEQLQKNRDMRDNSNRDIKDAQSNLFLGAGINEKQEQDKLGIFSTSQAERLDLTQDEATTVTKKLISGGVKRDDLRKYDAVYKAVRASDTKDAGALTESLMTMIKLNKGDINAPDKSLIDKTTNLALKGYKTELDNAPMLLAGVSDKISLEDKIALSNASKDANYGKERPSRTLLNEALGGDKGQINSKTFKALGITEDQYKQSLADLRSNPSYLDQTYATAKTSNKALDIRLQNEQNRSYQDPSELEEQQKMKLNAVFNNNRESGGTANEVIKNMIRWAVGEDNAQSTADFLQNPTWADGKLQEERSVYIESMRYQNSFRAKDLGDKKIDTSKDSKAVR